MLLVHFVLLWLACLGEQSALHRLSDEIVTQTKIQVKWVDLDVIIIINTQVSFECW